MSTGQGSSWSPTIRLARSTCPFSAWHLEVAHRFDQLAAVGTVGLSEMELLGLDDYRIHSAELAFPVLVSGTELEMQLVKLEELLPEITRRFPEVKAVDLRFSRQIVVQPAVEPRSQEGRG